MNSEYVQAESLDDLFEQQPGIAESIFQYLGGTFRFTAAVSRQFRALYTQAHGQEGRFTLCDSAVETIETVRIWLEDEEDAEARVFYMAATAAGRVEILEYLLTSGPPLDEWVHHGICERAAELGHVQVLQWACALDFKLNFLHTRAAAKFGHLEALQCLLQHECPWENGTCHYAARNGHLHVLVWAVTHGCKWDPSDCLRQATWNNQLHVCRWIRDWQFYDKLIIEDA